MQSFAHRRFLLPAAAALFAVAVAMCALPQSWSPWIRLEGGRFDMGSREANAATPPHEVTVAPFFIGRTEVTCGEYAEFTKIPARDPRMPATGVSYDDARAYCAWLSEKMGRHVRLPTEAEWEYAARGGIRGARYPWGWGSPEGRACFAARAAGRPGAFAANAFGLQDMAGNVAEWCAVEDGATNAVARGGSWADRDPDFLRVFTHVILPRGYRDADVGFRVVAE